jgi:phenylacetate-CoA ligase
MGKIAIECEVSGHYHVSASNVLLEVLDDDGRQVRPGDVGRVVVTSFYNYAMPFIRYEIGDYARLGGRCPCGRSLPVLTEILGRRRNMLSLPGGNRLWISGATLAALSEHVQLKRMRLRQTAVDRIELHYVPKDGDAAADQQGLDACAARLIHPGVRVVAVAVGDLPRSQGGKYEDVVGLN